MVKEEYQYVGIKIHKTPSSIHKLIKIYKLLLPLFFKSKSNKQYKNKNAGVIKFMLP